MARTLYIAAIAVVMTCTSVAQFQISQPLTYPPLRNQRKLQRKIPDSEPFPCKVEKMPEVPTSVHKLRPGDIQVVAALGDSTTAGNGAMGNMWLGVAFEGRGASFSIGGAATWREYLTIPNILKVFNPNLKGYSTKEALSLSGQEGLNYATATFTDEDLLFATKNLVDRMRKMPGIDMEKDWKLITIFIGHNDLCSTYCFRPRQHSAKSHSRNLQLTLDYLQQNVPRTFVNLIPVLDVSVVRNFISSLMCAFSVPVLCSCYFFFTMEGEIDRTAKAYQRAEEELVNSGRYDTKDDFTVVIQPITKFMNPERKEGLPDQSHITYDCFHFSQKGHAAIASLLWENMLQPIGNKSTVFKEFSLDKLRCPSETAPYFFTAKNSETFYATGHQ